MTLAITDAVPKLSPPDVDGGLRAAIIDPDRWAENVARAFDDFWRGRAAVYRIGAIAVPAIHSAAFDRFRLPSRCIRLHPSLLAAIGSLPIGFGRVPDMALLLELAETLAEEIGPRRHAMSAGANVITFPSFRRLEQMWERSDDYTTFPDGPSAA